MVDEFQIEVNPDSLQLLPGESTDIEVLIRNTHYLIDAFQVDVNFLEEYTVKSQDELDNPQDDDVSHSQGESDISPNDNASSFSDSVSTPQTKVEFKFSDNRLALSPDEEGRCTITVTIPSDEGDEKKRILKYTLRVTSDATDQKAEQKEITLLLGANLDKAIKKVVDESQSEECSLILPTEPIEREPGEVAKAEVIISNPKEDTILGFKLSIEGLEGDHDVEATIYDELLDKFVDMQLYDINKPDSGSLIMIRHGSGKERRIHLSIPNKNGEELSKELLVKLHPAHNATKFYSQYFTVLWKNSES